jgi:hypothetical protein
MAWDLRLAMRGVVAKSFILTEGLSGVELVRPHFRRLSGIGHGSPPHAGCPLFNH